MQVSVEVCFLIIEFRPSMGSLKMIRSEKFNLISFVCKFDFKERSVQEF